MSKHKFVKQKNVLQLKLSIRPKIGYVSNRFSSAERAKKYNDQKKRCFALDSLINVEDLYSDKYFNKERFPDSFVHNFSEQEFPSQNFTIDYELDLIQSKKIDSLIKRLKSEKAKNLGIKSFLLKKITDRVTTERDIEVVADCVPANVYKRSWRSREPVGGAFL